MYFKYLSAAFGSAMITSVYSIVDTAMVGQYHGPQGTAALAVVAPVWNIIYSLGLLMGIGGSVIFSTKRGSEKCDGSENQYFTSAVIGAVILSILAWIGAICFERPILTFFGADGSYHCPHLCVILPAAAVQHLLDLLFPGDHEAEGSVRCFCGTGTCHQRHFDHGSSCAGQRRCDLVCDASHGAAGHALRRFDDPQIHKGFAGRYHLCRYPPLKAMHPR